MSLTLSLAFEPHASEWSVLIGQIWIPLSDGIQKFRLTHDVKQGPRPRFVLCILPINNVALYNSIKSVADTKAGIYTVCVVGSKFMKEQGHVLLKFNLKASGINQTIDPAKLGVVGEGKTMSVGIDVTHPSPGSKEGASSVAGIAVSIDKHLGQ
jgi:hypothetical protein